MANFFKELGNIGTDIWHGAEQLGGHGVDAMKWLVKDMPQEIIDAPGRVNDELSRGLNKVGVRGWVGDNPLEAVGAAMVSIFAAPYAMSAGSSIFSSAGAGAGAGAPVSDAIGQSALDAVLSGGGTAGEVGSVSSGLDWLQMAGDTGKALNQMQGQQQQQMQQQQTQQRQLGASFTPTPIDNSLGQMQWANDNTLDLEAILGQLQGGVSGV